jgi:hypothetical protein
MPTAFAITVAIFSEASGSTLVCIKPIPLTIKEMSDRASAGLMSEDALQANTAYLTNRYCAITNENLVPASTVALGNDCELNQGARLGELVYWATCDEKREQAASEAAKSQATRRNRCIERCVTETMRHARNETGMYLDNSKNPIRNWTASKARENCQRNRAYLRCQN